MSAPAPPVTPMAFRRTHRSLVVHTIFFFFSFIFSFGSIPTCKSTRNRYAPWPPLSLRFWFHNHLAPFISMFCASFYVEHTPVVLSRTARPPGGDPRLRSTFIDHFGEHFSTVLHWAAFRLRSSSLPLLLIQYLVWRQPGHLCATFWAWSRFVALARLQALSKARRGTFLGLHISFSPLSFH